MIIANIIAFTLVLIGALNWGLVGIFNWNLVSAIFGVGLTIGARVIYILVFLASLWLIFYAIYSLGRIDMRLTELESESGRKTKHQKKDELN